MHQHELMAFITVTTAAGQSVASQRRKNLVAVSFSLVIIGVCSFLIILNPGYYAP